MTKTLAPHPAAGAGTRDRLATVTAAVAECQGQQSSSCDRKSAIELATAGLRSGSAVSCESDTARHLATLETSVDGR
jgi:hypothetical protein